MQIMSSLGAVRFLFLRRATFILVPSLDSLDRCLLLASSPSSDVALLLQDLEQAPCQMRQAIDLYPIRWVSDVTRVRVS